MRYLRALFPIGGTADDGSGSGGMLVIFFNLHAVRRFANSAASRLRFLQPDIPRQELTIGGPRTGNRLPRSVAFDKCINTSERTPYKIGKNRQVLRRRKLLYLSLIRNNRGVAV